MPYCCELLILPIMENCILARCKDRKISIFARNDINIRVSMNEEIRMAYPNEGITLTEIAFAAKRTWNYPESYFDIWKDELTITKEYIEKNIVFVYEKREHVVGFYSIVSVIDDFMAGNVPVKKGFWLEHLFIKPSFQHKGIGRKLMEHVITYCEENWIDELKIFVDPNAIGFYEIMGATFIENSPSSIEGREIPVYGFTITVV
jgi:maltose O-acetyltransferase